MSRPCHYNQIVAHTHAFIGYSDEEAPRREEVYLPGLAILYISSAINLTRATVNTWGRSTGRRQCVSNCISLMSSLTLIRYSPHESGGDDYLETLSLKYTGQLDVGSVYPI